MGGIYEAKGGRSKRRERNIQYIADTNGEFLSSEIFAVTSLVLERCYRLLPWGRSPRNPFYSGRHRGNSVSGRIVDLFSRRCWDRVRQNETQWTSFKSQGFDVSI